MSDCVGPYMKPLSLVIQGMCPIIRYVTAEAGDFLGDDVRWINQQYTWKQCDMVLKSPDFREKLDPPMEHEFHVLVAWLDKEADADSALMFDWYTANNTPEWGPTMDVDWYQTVFRGNTVDDSMLDRCARNQELLALELQAARSVNKWDYTMSMNRPELPDHLRAY